MNLFNTNFLKVQEIKCAIYLIVACAVVKHVKCFPDSRATACAGPKRSRNRRKSCRWGRRVFRWCAPIHSTWQGAIHDDVRLNNACVNFHA